MTVSRTRAHCSKSSNDCRIFAMIRRVELLRGKLPRFSHDQFDIGVPGSEVGGKVAFGLLARLICGRDDDVGPKSHGMICASNGRRSEMKTRSTGFNADTINALHSCLTIGLPACFRRRVR